MICAAAARLWKSKSFAYSAVQYSSAAEQTATPSVSCPHPQHNKECILATERRSAGLTGGAERSTEKPRRPRRALALPRGFVRNAPKFNRRRGTILRDGALTNFAQSRGKLAVRSPIALYPRAAVSWDAMGWIVVVAAHRRRRRLHSLYARRGHLTYACASVRRSPHKAAAGGRETGARRALGGAATCREPLMGPFEARLPGDRVARFSERLCGPAVIP